MALIKTIVLIGAPGSGKGTQADLLASAVGAVHLSSGQVLRDNAPKEILAEMKQGQLVTESAVDTILEASLQAANTEAIWILDGFIRLTQDRVWLENCLQELDRKIDVVIIIDTPEEVCKSRVLSRGRTDDTESAWTKRWKEYEATTIPVIDSLMSLPYIRIQGDGDPEAINAGLLTQLREKGIG